MNLPKKLSSGDLRNLVFLLHDQNASLQKRTSSLQNENTCLKEQLNWFQKQLFGKKSEKEIPLNKDQLSFKGFEEIPASEEELKAIKAHTRKSSKKEITKITIPQGAPVKCVILDLPENEKICKITGVALKKFGEEVSIKLIHKPGSYYIQKTIRPKYALPNGEGVKIAELPDSIIPKCRVDEGILADMVGIEVGDTEIEKLNIEGAKFHPEWNYTIRPNL